MEIIGPKQWKLQLKRATKNCAQTLFRTNANNETEKIIISSAANSLMLTIRANFILKNHKLAVQIMSSP